MIRGDRLERLPPGSPTRVAGQRQAAKGSGRGPSPSGIRPPGISIGSCRQGIRSELVRPGGSGTDEPDQQDDGADERNQAQADPPAAPVKVMQATDGDRQP